MDETPYNIDLIVAMKSTFQNGVIINNVNNNSIRLKMTSWTATATAVEWLLDGYRLPEFRMKQFRRFQSALRLGMQGRFRCFNGFCQLLDIVYDMNRDGSLRRKSKQQLISEAREYFSQPNRLNYVNFVVRFRNNMKKRYETLGTSNKPKSELYRKILLKIQKQK